METSEKTKKSASEQDSAEKQRAERARKTVIVVGASSGIGYETALRLVGRGYSVVNISRTPCGLERVKNYAADVTVGDTLGKADWRSFEKLARLSGLEKPVGTGAAIGLTPRAFAVSDTAVAHGPEWIWERRLTLGRARLTEDANEDASA